MRINTEECKEEDRENDCKREEREVEEEFAEEETIFKPRARTVNRLSVNISNF